MMSVIRSNMIFHDIGYFEYFLSIQPLPCPWEDKPCTLSGRYINSRPGK